MLYLSAISPYVTLPFHEKKTAQTWNWENKVINGIENNAKCYC